MGRKHSPTALKLLKGTARKSRLNIDEPKPALNIPTPPDHLDQIASVEWGRISQELYKLGLLTNIDRSPLAAYCVVYSRWVDAEMRLKKEGTTLVTTNGNIIQSPLVGISNQAMILMHKYLIEFGMTPASRAKVSVKKGKKDNGWGDYS